MPLPQEVLDRIKIDIEKADKQVSDLEGTISNLRASGIDASKQEERLEEVKTSLRKLSTFYELESKRIEIA